MTFSQEIKQELANLRPAKPCCMLSELNALTRFAGSLTLRGGGRAQITYRFGGAMVAKRAFFLLKKRMNASPEIRFTESPRFGGRRECLLTLNDKDSRALMEALNMLSPGEELSGLRSAPRGVAARKCCKRAYLRGAFLAAGAATSPEKGYQIEFSAPGERVAETLCRAAKTSGVEMSVSDRRGASVVYCKSGDGMATLLSLMGATQAMMKMENIRAQRAIRGNVARAVNCDSSNTIRQMDAAQAQVRALTALSLKRGLGGLPGDLGYVARLRMANPSASLSELAELSEIPLSRSAMTRRLQKLMLIANEE